MSKVFVQVGMSVDGFIAGPNGGPTNPLGDGGMRIHRWVYPLATFRDRVGLSGGDVNRDDAIVKASFARTGAYVMGRRLFDEGEVGWPENPPFRAPVFVVTHHAREPWVRKGGTTFTFVTSGIMSALDQARAVAGNKDIRISGGANVIQQFVRAGLVDELLIHLAPVLVGGGVRLFDQVGPEQLALEVSEVVASPMVTHLRYRRVRGVAAAQ
jgi:dihydrofolate reductase